MKKRQREKLARLNMRLLDARDELLESGRYHQIIRVNKMSRRVNGSRAGRRYWRKYVQPELDRHKAEKCKAADIEVVQEVCGFSEAWVGNCKNPKPCCKHAKLVCVSCGNPATHSCDETGQFVCGANLCDECEHTIGADGTNCGVGFNADSSLLPEGYNMHCKKTEQVYLPWYSRPTVAADNV
jgi:hypothetical protein